jgi:hypothetical protein
MGLLLALLLGVVRWQLGPPGACCAGIGVLQHTQHVALPLLACGGAVDCSLCTIAKQTSARLIDGITQALLASHLVLLQCWNAALPECAMGLNK